MNRNICTSRRIYVSGLLAMVTVLSTACANPNDTDELQVTPAEPKPEMSREERMALRLEMQQQKNFERAAVNETVPVTGEVPDDLLDKVMADLEQHTSAARSDFTVQRAEAVQWNDGSLGCPEPGQVYPQAIIQGFWIVIEHQDQGYDYRASDTGYFKLCPGPSLTR